MAASKTRRLFRTTRRIAVEGQSLADRSPQSDDEERMSVPAYDHLAALERLNRMVAGFASMVSHETRSALVGIQGASELIRFGGLSPDEVQACATDIFDQAQRINVLIGEIFDLSRLETSEVRLRKAEVDLNAIARDIAEDQWGRPGRPTVTLELTRDLPHIFGDPDRLRQAVSNFMSFALRQASQDSLITIRTEIERNGVRLGVVSDSMRVTNFDDWLFGHYERYEQKPSSIMGVGLGLAIARVIVELHNGHVWVERTAELTAELNLRIPLPHRPL